jgi:hypothetical protein
MNGNDALAALWDALDQGHKPPPPNSITIVDYATRYGLSRDAAACKLRTLERSGQLEAALFKTPGDKRLTRYYWLPKKVKK